MNEMLPEELQTAAPLTHNQQEYSVSEISQLLRRTVEDNFSWVRVRGEISGLKRASSGHIYFNLKDADAVLNVVCWKGVAARLTFLLEDGMESVCSGRLTTYAGRSSYQLSAVTIEPAGAGALMALLEKRKQALATEGLFDEARKKPLPFLPRVIGVVTSPTGAVLRDILHRLRERFPVHVLVWPVLVQGEGAAAQVVAAIAGFNALDSASGIPRPDLIIVARGGGSLEDLWAFNEENVVRAAAASRIPLISAVGHETDTTLIDYASDKRAPTPTASAEMAVPVREELLATVLDYRTRLHTAVTRSIGERRAYLEALARGLPHPRRLLELMAQKLDDWGERHRESLPRLLQKKQQQLAVAEKGLQPGLLRQRITMEDQRVGALSRLLESYHYTKVLARGFALVRNGAGELVASAEAAQPGMALEIEFRDGRKNVLVAGGGKAPRRWGQKKEDDQESLF